LLGSLFVIYGGIHVRGSLAGTPLTITALLGIGAVLANLVGTTGASMLLVRPLLRAIDRRRRKAHIVLFFIFVVSNCGGLLTPPGDPPLFLGFLKGVPFAWTLGLWKPWLVVIFLAGVVLAILGKGQGWGNGAETWPFGIQEGLLAALAAGSSAPSSRGARRPRRSSPPSRAARSSWGRTPTSGTARTSW